MNDKNKQLPICVGVCDLPNFPAVKIQLKPAISKFFFIGFVHFF